MTYLNLTTNEYPRFPGDVELAPNDEWVEVKETPMPNVGEFEILEYGQPELVDGEWKQTWTVRPMSEEEKEYALAPKTAKEKLVALGLTEIEIEALLRGLR